MNKVKLTKKDFDSVTISVVIPTYYRHDVLKDVLKNFEKQTCIPEEFIVVDQTPIQDRPNNFYDDFKLNIKLIEPIEASAPIARNMGAQHAKNDFLLIIDDDIIFKDNYVEMYKKVLLEEHVDVINGGTTLKSELPNDWPWDISEMDPVRFFLAAPNHNWKGMQLSISSCNFLINRELYLAAGGFDIKCPRMQDFEFGYRLYKFGAKILYSNLPWCQHLRASGGLRKKPFRNAALVGAIYIHKKHFPGWITKQFILKQILRMKVIYRPWLLIKLILAYWDAMKFIKANDSLMR